MLTSKRIADVMTVSRLVLAILMIWLGVTAGASVIGLIAWLLIVSWTTDCLDGILARRNKPVVNNWIGEHDLEFDISVAFGVLVYLAAAGFINLWLAILYCLIWMGVFWLFGLRSALGKLFQAPVYGWFILVVLWNAPGPGYWLLAWILVVVLLTWPRFPNEVIPSFFAGFRETNSR
ncbi:MAG: CDP-alcohol phosphatidyltransferase family protein [Anaerolineales bacterium]|nr:MAG: CDP-alcohol phosphatidyltransferase family protein [Anaerolineales bacterium]